MSDLHIPEYSPHRCTPTADAYAAAVRALEKHRSRSSRAGDVLNAWQTWREQQDDGDPGAAFYDEILTALTEEN
ncbi:hypothetical protein [Actinoplanes rectilineatus]|uniref:hypothetical protein n=1 Tax=Actinoplanes rectilineatus TaxID=113571 RepID=UPI000AEB9A19|nr:hypothetical protein [Actinoplanes rectilineatus]